MPNVQLTDEQVVDLVKQLPPARQAEVVKLLLSEQRRRWEEFSRGMQEGARKAAAERGRDWDVMTEEEREDFVDELVHEDRPCRY